MRLIGDLPFFVSPDSSDVWANPELFLLDEQPPADGRRGSASRLLQRGRDSSGATPSTTGTRCARADIAGASTASRAAGPRGRDSAGSFPRVRGGLARTGRERSTAQAGQWVPGPGAEFFSPSRRSLGALPFIAEDLGLITPDVTALRDQFQSARHARPSVRVRRPFGQPVPAAQLRPNTVVYTGTHDNPTTRGWYEESAGPSGRTVWSYLKRSARRQRRGGAGVDALAWSIRAALAIAPLQDLLNLGNEARMNVPGRADGNWRWRCTERDAVRPGLRMAARPDEDLESLC